MKKMICLFMSLWLIYPVSILALTEKAVTNTDQARTEIVTLEACVDGDTAKFKTSSEEVIKARFLAIDTPETVHPTKGEEPYGKEASNYTCTALTNAKEITLEYDNGSDEEDFYGRKLVWVFVDGVLLQDSLVSQGYAEVTYLYGDYKYTSLLQDSEAIAKANKVGIWSEENVIEDTATSLDEEKEESEEEKSFLDKIVEDLLGMIFDFINDLIEKLLKMIEDML